MSTKETSFVNNFISSIKDIERYPEMATKSFGKVIKYFIQLMVIFTLIITLSSLYGVSKNIKDAILYIKTEMPDFNYTDDILTVNSQEKIEIKPNDLIDLIIIDTNEISQDIIDDYIKQIQSHDTGLIILKDKLIADIGRGIISYSYKDISNTYNISDMNKESILNYFTGTNLVMFYVGIFIMSFISLFIAHVMSVTIDIIALALIGYATSLILRLRLKFIAIVKIVMYSLTLPILLNLLYIVEQNIFGFEIKYFEVMYIAISYIYIISAILMIKSDIIKRGQELTKIIEEEQKIKEQLEKEKQQEEEERKRQEEKKKENKKDKKKEKEETEKENVGEEPQGENA